MRRRRLTFTRHVMMRGRVHTREFKPEVCQQISRGEKRPAQICWEHEVASSLLAR